MKREFTFKRLVAAIFMMFVAIWGMNAQDQVYPWHVVVKNANGTEVASHSVELISDLQATADSAIFLLSTGSRYAYPITFTFSFAQREGGGTAIQTVAAPKWNVFYGNSALNFTQQVNNVAIYSVSGVLVNRFNGNSKTIPVNLSQGLYIVQADGNAAKLLVASNGSGGASMQSTVANTASQPEVANAVQTSMSATNGSSTPLKAATAAFKQYWNINAGNTITPIDIGTVNTFHITTDNTIVFDMKDGNTVQMTNYQSTSFSTQPTTSQNIDWDVAKTILYGGATYAWGSNPPAITWAAVHKNGLAFFSVVMDNSFSEVQRINNSDIDPTLWEAANNPDSRLAAFFVYTPIKYGMSYSGIADGWQMVYLMSPTGVRSESWAGTWSYNNNTNIIPTTFIKDGTKLIMACVDYNGETWSYSFITW